MKRLVHTLIAFLLSISTLGQTPQKNSSPTQGPANVGFIAIDRKDRSVPDIKQSDLTLLDNKQPARSILFLKRGSELPLRLGLLIDASNSERASSIYVDEVKAASDLLNQVVTGPDDRALVVKISTVPEATAFMDRGQLLSYKVDLTPGGATALYDGIALACKRMKEEATQPSRRVLILLSDGDDNLSRVNHEEVIASALEAGTVIFAVSTEDDSVGFGRRGMGNTRLKQFAESTGGEAFLHLWGKSVQKAFSTIREQIENMYNVSYEPAESDTKGFHSVELKLSTGDKTRVRAAKGYYVK